MKYPLKTYQDFLQEIKNIENIILEMGDDEERIKGLRAKIAAGKERMEEKFNQLKLF